MEGVCYEGKDRNGMVAQGEVQGVRGLVKDIKEIKAYLQDNMKAGMCWNGYRLKRNDTQKVMI